MVELIWAGFGQFYKQAIGKQENPLASQAERGGSIPPTRSTLLRKGLMMISSYGESDGFTGSFTLLIPYLFLSGLFPTLPRLMNSQPRDLQIDDLVTESEGKRVLCASAL